MRLVRILLVLMFVSLGLETASAAEPPWAEIYSGIFYKTISRSTKVKQSVHIVRIDLRAKGVSFLVTPSNGDAEKEVDALKTSSFLKIKKCQVAINGSVFSPKALSRGQGLNVHGLGLSSGELYSKPTKFDALLIERGNKPRISSPPHNLERVENALSGYYKVLDSGRVVGSKGKRHPRSLIGLSRSGRYMFLVVIDGRRPGISQGASLFEAGEIMREVGAWTALNMDGGGSSTLVSSDGAGGSRLLNRPSDGVERLVANHLCVFASSAK